MHPDSEKSVGFFDKVMQKVRGNARAPQAPNSAMDSQGARGVQQAVLARKRRNEAIRKHEFAQLRLLRQRSEAGDPANAAGAAKDEAASSFLGLETRSNETLQKIDAIEAQMSDQWWRSSTPASGKSPPRAQGGKPAQHPPLNARQLSDLPVLGEDCVVEARTSVALADPKAVGPAILGGAAAPVEPPAAIRTFQPHPDLEEAAILFAHGDLDGARARLLEQLVQGLSAHPVDADKNAVLWHAVLDVCRAVGDEEAFEPLAIDYAEHFGRSAPLWTSMPARLGMAALGAAGSSPASSSPLPWSCPSKLTVGVVAALRQAQAEATQPWSMSWRRLTAIDEAALLPLAQLLERWSSHPGHIVCSDADTLLELLAHHAVLGASDCSPQWWLARMALLRLMHRMEAYEHVALDYCVTYEISPPSWVAPVCRYVEQQEGDAETSAGQAAAGASPQPLLGIKTAQGELAEVQPAFSGVLEGDLQALLLALAAQARHGQTLSVACDDLIRLDFVAAGSVLNWAADMQSQGHTLRFTQLHQLVAVFFCVIGIHEHAAVQATMA